ncbi:MAG: radical SAM protein [Gemmatimonadetes bacterium]|nr:radical SAM protein [Gemmatimonadota bacterium]
MDLEARLDLLMSLAADDREGPPTRIADAPASGAASTSRLPPRLRHTRSVGALRPLNIRSLRLRGGGRMSLMRVLMTNACSFNCHYCPMRRDRDLPRTLLKPEELVRIFLEAHRRRWCGGLFVTTGIPGRPVKVMDDLIRALELLRETHGFRGYIHVKMVPGGEPAQIARLTALASRVSINLETPCGASLLQIAPEKRFATTLANLESARAQVVRQWGEEADGRPRDRSHPNGASGMTMQFVVGATPDSDRDVLAKVTDLYAGGGIHHAHFSAFRPIRDTPMEEHRAAPALREHRLYQADYLLRTYDFGRDEIVFDTRGNIPLERDPKTTWALAHPERFPIDVRTAEIGELVRVPGIGPATARRLVEERPRTTLRGLTDLRRLGVITKRAAGFLTLAGRRLAGVRWVEQLDFWRAEDEVGAYRFVYQVSPGTFR